VSERPVAETSTSNTQHDENDIHASRCYSNPQSQ